MLTTQLLHPEILQALAANGHGARILIADGNFPVTTKTPLSAKKVFLNLAPDLLKVTDVLKVVKEFIPIESAMVITPPDMKEQPIHTEFRGILGVDMEWKVLKRFEFYEQAGVADTCLAIATGETRRFANILLTIGVVVR
jgi:L-fucose mutarotase